MSLRIGVIGLGIGRMHLRYYKEMKDVEIVSIADVNPARLKEVSEEYGVKGYEDGKKMLESEKLDGVSLCTPPKSHLELTREAANRGINVLCEKPMAPTLEDCDEMIKVCEKNEVKLMIGFKKRFAPAYLFLKEKIAKEFGLPFWAFCQFSIGYVSKDWFWDPEDGGGPISENTVHVMDALRFLMGEVDRVYAEGDNFIAKDKVEIDGATFTLRFKNGGIAAIGAGSTSEWLMASEHLWVHFPRAVAELGGKLDLPNNLKFHLRGSSEIQEKTFEDPSGFRGEIEHFVDCIKNNLEPKASGLDGKKALEICLAVKKSAKTHRPVKIR